MKVRRKTFRTAIEALRLHAEQSEAHFPAFPSNYLARLKAAAKSPRPAVDAQFIASLLDGSDDTCGFQRLRLADPALIQESERWLTEGRFEPFLKSRKKYEEFSTRLRAEPGFRIDWASLKRAFPRETATKKIIHRTLVPERNWVRDGGARFTTRRQRFQACFDLLCWKYCLWGVGRGRPLLLKPSVVVTPFGTQIFIPAYFSFDAKRDLNLGLITKLHRARGLQRQGEGFSTSRQERLNKQRAARKVDKKARALGFRGDRRYKFIAEELGLIDQGDYRAVRRLLSAGKRQ